MPVFKARRLLSIPPDIAYAVAADVASYREFLPLLEQSAVDGEVQEIRGVKTFRANLTVGYKKLGLREQFVSNVTCDQSARRVTATSSERPFRHMKTVWSIANAGNRAEVSIEIDYAMRNPLLQIALAGVMEIAVNKVMAAFEQRARNVYEAASSSI